MPLINKNNVPFIKEGSLEWRTETGVTTLRSWHDNYYFLIEFFDGDSLHLSLNFLNDSLLDDIRKQKVVLVLSNTHEAFHSVVFPIYKFFIYKLQIPESQILLLTESSDIDKTVLDVAEKLNKLPIRVEWSRIFEQSIQNEIIHNPSTVDTLTYKNYDKKFLNFNRRWRLHRPVLVALLHCNNLLSKGFVSLANSDDNRNWNNTWNTLLDLCKDDKELIALLENNKESILSLPNLYVDRKDLENNHVTIGETSKDFYSKTYFSVVTETNFFETIDPSQFISEKTFKPIAEKHPFILVGRPGSLDKLKQIGYRTFHPIIDESYDKEYNDTIRIKKIVNEINRLSNLKDIELKTFLHRMKKISDHNFKVLISKKEFTTRLL